jgi:hypothetical protein
VQQQRDATEAVEALLIAPEHDGAWGIVNVGAAAGDLG